ncbi:LOW QUALITY PROTEIN: integrin alpha-3-like, partial [Polymixia lowei]
CFNLDTRFPLVKEGGSRGSLFGLSVALHQQTEGRFLLLVGAPKEKAEAYVSANQTGGVYSCPITTDQSDCTRMNLIDNDLDEAEDLVEDMWLGVSVASQSQPGGRVLACGHRFVKLYGAFRLRHMIGKCYLRGNDLQYDPADDHWQNPDQVCSHLGDVTSEVMCNMGISSAITQTEVIVGSPGSYEWQGNVHVSRMNPDVLYDTQRSSFNNMDRRHIYIGYSVAQAPHLLSQDAVTIVTGAPKDSKEDVHGSVLLAERRQTGTESRLVLLQTIHGEQMGSYYGNSLAVTDINNDGWADLLVGAPFYFHRQRDEGGAVYVYMNQGGRLGPQASSRLHGAPGSAFGMALVAIGDINQDGFQDFAVGAPFHGTGSVMIWTGSATGLSEKPSQVIEGRDVSGGGFSTFGYSLSGGLDVDQNRYPDLLVGSLDDRVALLRARPVIHLNKTLTVTPDVIDPNSCDHCVQVEVCFSYILSTGDKTFRKNITIQFTVEADVTRHNSRLRFHDNGQDVYSGFLSMPSQRCRTLKLTLVRPVQDKIEALVFSLNVSLYQNPSRNRRTLQNLDHYPVLSQNTPQTSRTQIHILKACGSDNRCHSNLQMTAQFTNQELVPFPFDQGVQLFHYDSSIKKLFLVVEVTNLPLLGRPAEDAYSAVLNITIPSLKYSGVRTKSPGPVVECSGGDQVRLCKLGNPFSSKQQSQVLIIFETSEINLETREIHTHLQLSTLSEQSDLSPVSVFLLVEYSLQTTFSLIKQPGHTQFSGHVIGESAMKTTRDIGSPLHFTFKVDIVGKPLGHLGNLEVEFDWPWESSNGKWLLYLTEIQLNGTSKTRCVPPGNIINPLNLTLSEERRRRRSMEVKQGEEEQRGGPQAALNLQGIRRRSYTLDCVNGAARCVKFICPLVNMNTSATLTVNTHLWNSTMIEDYSDVWLVEVRGQATLKLVTDKPTIKMNSQTVEFSVDIRPEQGELEDSSAPLWVIIVSVLAGVLLLAVICLLLWKCGFFVRRVGPGMAVALHQGRIMGKEQRYTNSDGFLIQDDITSSKNRKQKKHWVTSWTETHTY